MLRIMEIHVKRSHVSDDCGGLICLCRVLLFANEKYISKLFKPPLFCVFLNLQMNLSKLNLIVIGHRSGAQCGDQAEENLIH